MSKINFKCRCAKNFNKRIGNMKLMSGYFPYRENIIHSFKPYGLHRIWYRCIFDETEKMTTKKKIIRNSERLTKSKDFHSEIQFAYF